MYTPSTKAVRDLKFESRVETRVFENGTRETRDRDSGPFNFLSYVLKFGKKPSYALIFEQVDWDFKT